MKSDTPLDYAVFQLSPRRSRCELLVSSDGNTEKLASGLVKPFVTHLKVAEEQVALAVPLIKLEIGRHKNADTWFTKGTLERFVRFVSTPEVLEMVNTLDAEMSQLEAARRIYSQGAGDQQSDAQGGNGAGATAAADATKNELLKAIDLRLTAVRQDLTAACSRASAAGFNPDAVSELQQFADRFGAYRLNEACTKFMSLYQRRPDLISRWRAGVDDRYLRSSVGSDMSIDDPPEDQSGSHLGLNPAHLSDQSKSSTWQQPRSAAAFASRRNSNVNEKNNNTTNESKEDIIATKQKKEAGPTESSPPFTTPAAPPARRLSVQDRINLFENKQKENSGGSDGIIKPVVGKSVELKRLSSDVPAGPTSVAAAEKSVLRRWSGASDMSIDLSGEKKDIESPLCTPPFVSQTRSNNTVSDSSENKDQRVLLNNSQNKLDAALKDQTEARHCSGVSAAKDEEEGGFNVTSNRKDQAASTKLRSFIGRAEQVVKIDQFSSQDTSEVPVFDQKRAEVAPQKSIGVVSTTVGDVTSDVKVRREDSGVRSRLAAQSLRRASHSHSRSFSGQFEGVGGIKFDEASSVKVEVEKSHNQPQWGSSTGEVEDLLKKDTTFSSKQQIKVRDSEVSKMNYQKSNSSSREQTSKSHDKRDETRAVYNSKLNLPGKEGMESQESVHGASLVPLEQVQRVRQSKGNNGLNDELKMKVNELEKLFAEHKMRVPGEQSGFAHRIEPADIHAEYEVNSQSRGPGAGELTPPLPARNTPLNRPGSLSNLANFDAKSLMKMVENHFSDVNFRDDSRGKFYEKYMQKRDAKLREDWNSNRAEKEARMKAMQDSLERSRAEMKAKFSGSTDRQDSISGACQHAEKIRSFNFRSNINREQHPINSLQNEEGEDLSDFPDEKTYCASKESKKNLLYRNMSSTTPRTAAASVSRSSVKVSNSSSGRRRDNPLAQSVPNFSDLRKENTRPSSGVSKTTTRSQARNYSRSKSTNEEMAGIKEEKSKRAQSLRKSSANPAEFKDLSPLNSDSVVLDPLKFDMDAVRMQASMESEMQKNEESDELEFEEEDDGIETMAIGDGTLNGKVRRSQDSMKSSGSEIGDSTRSLTELEPVSAAEMPTAIPSAFNNVGSLHDSPVESPVSWNSRLRYSFSYPHEASDIDASVDSPIGSPAYWNSHSLAHTETDAARMRKKWGSAQKPILVANASHNQSRKDVTKGFKRLLKFGRKNRGSESLVDWISATTSEGDDDTEDGRDPANRSSEDLRKTRMGFPQGLPSDDSFNESELFNEQVQSLRSSIPAPPAQFKLRDDHISGSSLKAPRSFFSLSSFRNKGGDAKPR